MFFCKPPCCCGGCDECPIDEEWTAALAAAPVDSIVLRCTHVPEIVNFEQTQPTGAMPPTDADCNFSPSLASLVQDLVLTLEPYAGSDTFFIGDGGAVSDVYLSEAITGNTTSASTLNATNTITYTDLRIAYFTQGGFRHICLVGKAPMLGSSVYIGVGSFVQTFPGPVDFYWPHYYFGFDTDGNDTPTGEYTYASLACTDPPIDATTYPAVLDGSHRWVFTASPEVVGTVVDSKMSLCTQYIPDPCGCAGTDQTVTVTGTSGGTYPCVDVDGTFTFSFKTEPDYGPDGYGCRWTFYNDSKGVFLHIRHSASLNNWRVQITDLGTFPVVYYESGDLGTGGADAECSADGLIGSGVLTNIPDSGCPGASWSIA